MRWNLSININEPVIDSVFDLMMIPMDKVDDLSLKLFDEAKAVFSQYAKPVGLACEISGKELMAVLNGQGNNSPDTPFGEIFEDAYNPSLFAVTAGKKLTDEISRLFDKHDYPLASMLDAMASVGAENASEKLENIYLNYLNENNKINSDEYLMQFSPGYCGWHISAQKKLFEILKPDEISISLNISYLMSPLKSISGVMVSGKKELFNIEDKFSFCKECKNHTCIDRYNKLLEEK